MTRWTGRWVAGQPSLRPSLGWPARAACRRSRSRCSCSLPPASPGRSSAPPRRRRPRRHRRHRPRRRPAERWARSRSWAIPSATSRLVRRSRRRRQPRRAHESAGPLPHPARPAHRRPDDGPVRHDDRDHHPDPHARRPRARLLIMTGEASGEWAYEVRSVTPRFVVGRRGRAARRVPGQRPRPVHLGTRRRDDRGLAAGGRGRRPGRVAGGRRGVRGARERRLRPRGGPGPEQLERRGLAVGRPPGRHARDPASRWASGCSRASSGCWC